MSQAKASQYLRPGPDRKHYNLLIYIITDISPPPKLPTGNKGQAKGAKKYVTGCHFPRL